MLIPRWTPLLAAAVLIPAAQAGAAPHHPVAADATACSSKGLNLSYRAAGVTEAVKVTALRAIGVDCNTAQALARAVAKLLLHNEKVPAKVEGFTVRVKSPCVACTPDSQVTATQPRDKVTFELIGGA